MSLHALLNFRRSPSARSRLRRRPARARLAVERLEGRSLPSFTNVLVNDPTADHFIVDTQSETAVVLGAGGTVVVAFNDSGSVVNLDLTTSGWALSTDGGASFTDEGTPPPNKPDIHGGDPALARSSSTGTIFMSTGGGRRIGTPPNFVATGAAINVFRSIDNGATFQAAVNGAAGLDPNVDHTDKPWIAVDNFPGPGQGNVYLVWRNYSLPGDVAQPNPDRNAILLARSTDDGLTWGPDGGTVIDPVGDRGINANQLPFVTVGPDHAVYVFWWQFREGPGQDPELVMRKSTDQGVTFGDTVLVTDLRTTGLFGDLGLTDDSGRVFRSPCSFQAAVNPVNGDLYVVFHDKGNGSADRGDAFFTQSKNGGKHWSKPLRLNDDATANDQWMPALAVTPDGSHVGVFWYDRRLDPANNLIDRFGVIGTVTGRAVHFGANFRVTDVSFPPAFGQDPFVERTFGDDYMGDYDMAAADNGFFYTTWGDNRLGDAFHANQPDVRLAKIPVTGPTASGAVGAFTSSSGAAPAPASPLAFSPTAAVNAPAAGAARGTDATGALAALPVGVPPTVTGLARLPAGTPNAGRKHGGQPPQQTPRAAAVVAERGARAVASAAHRPQHKHQGRAFDALGDGVPDLFGPRPDR
jgi:hypothetical protein